MRARNIRIEHRRDNGTLRLLADVCYGNGDGKSKTIWIDVDDPTVNSLSMRADPWICYLLPLAALHNQPAIRVEGEASRQLLDSIPLILSAWKSWYPTLREDVAIEPDDVIDSPKTNVSDVGMFFSGGVDSWYSLLDEDSRDAGVDGLITVIGWDIALENEDAVASITRSHREVARSLNKSLAVVKTNMHDLRSGQNIRWGPLTHGSALATVAHALSNRFGRVLISATHSPGLSRPWGSHPTTDPLFSSEMMEIIHHGFTTKRIDKMRLITQYQLALDHLHVCWKLWDNTNCGKCEKCLRTILSLELLDARSRAKTFPARDVGPADYRRIKADSPGVRMWMEELKALAETRERTDLAAALDRCMRRGRVYQWAKNCVPESIIAPNGVLRKPLRAIWKRI